MSVKLRDGHGSGPSADRVGSGYGSDLWRFWRVGSGRGSDLGLLLPHILCIIF